MLTVLGLLALLGVWVLAVGGGGGKKDESGANGKNPAPTITPGPSGSGPAISQAPGGRDESSSGSDGSSSGSSSGAGAGSSSSAGGDDGSGSGDSSGDSGDGGGSSTGDGDGSTGTGSTGGQLPAGSTLPDCTASVVKLTLSSRHNAYSPDQAPAFVLTVKNSSGSDCKIDLGPRSAVLTITQSGGADHFWSSEDCPAISGSVLYRVPAGGSTTYTVTWKRTPSAPDCGTPSEGSAGSGTYLVEAVAPGFAKLQTSFVLAKD